MAKTSRDELDAATAVCDGLITALGSVALSLAIRSRVDVAALNGDLQSTLKLLRGRSKVSGDPVAIYALEKLGALFGQKR